jgi:hypothetical protein
VSLESVHGSNNDGSMSGAIASPNQDPATSQSTFNSPSTQGYGTQQTLSQGSNLSYL